MKISQVIQILKAEKAFNRTPKGRSINEYTLDIIDASLQDTKNYEMDAVKCKNCGIILSSLLVPSGCPNCGSKDITTEEGEQICKK